MRAGLGHGADERQQLAAGHETRGADQECRDFHVGIAIVREIVDDGADFVGFSDRPWILARTASRLLGGVAGVTVTRLPAGSPKRRNAGSARPSSPGPDQSVVIGDQQRRQQRFRVVAQFDPAEAPKHLRPQRLRAARHDHDVFAAGVEIDSNYSKVRPRRVGIDHAELHRCDTDATR